ncbi:MAG: diphosphomevalonate decarboxylase [Calditrichaceae bacterium]|nr:diphosphomevalonate decarboxylase [Calditrichaceae bacterium]
MKATAIAHSNIALVKYWGKRNGALNLPAVGSISITLDALSTTTNVEFVPGLNKDQLFLNDIQVEGKEQIRVQNFMNLVRRESGIKNYTVIKSGNNFPTAAGLASSASAFAALALAGTTAAGLKVTKKDLTILARIGSGSAARSIFGGFVEMHKGIYKNGSDAFAEPLADENYWDLRVLIAVTSESKKKIGSTDGMTQSKKTSPYYRNWIAASPKDLSGMRAAIKQKNFTKLGEISEFSCLKMHALALATTPALIYWNGTTVDGMHLIRELRGKGSEVYFTIDAGPQLKAICQAKDEHKIKRELEALPGVVRVISTKIGGPARIIGESV